jgi:HPt (histidine-containing phosphotransfer) domain-containing protein
MEPDDGLEPMHAGAIDMPSLLAQFGGDSEGVEKLLLSFLREGPETAASLGRALSARDASEAGRAAHRLKGVLAWISARPAAAIAADVETLARSGDLDSASDRLPDLARELDRVFAAVRAATARPSGR